MDEPLIKVYGVVCVCVCVCVYCTVLYCTVLYCTVLYCTVLYCTVLYCTVLYCTVLYCTVLYCTVLCVPDITIETLPVGRVRNTASAFGRPLYALACCVELFTLVDICTRTEHGTIDEVTM